MENEMKDDLPQEPNYTPRPRWQVILARIGLVVFLAFLMMYYMIWFRGGA